MAKELDWAMGDDWKSPWDEPKDELKAYSTSQESYPTMPTPKASIPVVPKEKTWWDNFWDNTQKAIDASGYSSFAGQAFEAERTSSVALGQDVVGGVEKASEWVDKTVVKPIAAKYVALKPGAVKGLLTPEEADRMFALRKETYIHDESYYANGRKRAKEVMNEINALEAKMYANWAPGQAELGLFQIDQNNNLTPEAKNMMEQIGRANPYDPRYLAYKNNTKPLIAMVDIGGLLTGQLKPMKWGSKDSIELAVSLIVDPTNLIGGPGKKQVAGVVLLGAKRLLMKEAGLTAVEMFLKEAGVAKKEILPLIEHLKGKTMAEIEEQIKTQAIKNIRGYTVHEGGQPDSDTYSYMHGLMDNEGTLHITDAESHIHNMGEQMLEKLRQQTGAKNIVVENMLPTSEASTFWKRMEKQSKGRLTINPGEMTPELVAVHDAHIAEYLKTTRRIVEERVTLEKSKWKTIFNIKKSFPLEKIYEVAKKVFGDPEYANIGDGKKSLANVRSMLDFVYDYARLAEGKLPTQETMAIAKTLIPKITKHAESLSEYLLELTKNWDPKDGAGLRDMHEVRDVRNKLVEIITKISSNDAHIVRRGIDDLVHTAHITEESILPQIFDIDRTFLDESDEFVKKIGWGGKGGENTEYTSDVLKQVFDYLAGDKSMEYANMNRGTILTSGFYPVPKKFVPPLHKPGSREAMISAGKIVIPPTNLDISLDIWGNQIDIPQWAAKALLPLIHVGTRTRTIIHEPIMMAKAIEEWITAYKTGIIRTSTMDAKKMFINVEKRVKGKVTGIDLSNQWVDHDLVTALDGAPMMKLADGTSVPSKHIIDIIENPTKYSMPPEMKALVDECNRISRECTTMCEEEAKRMGVPFKRLKGEPEWVYFKRVVEEIGGIEKQNYAQWENMTRPRKFETAGQGWLDEYMYAHPMADLETMVDEAYDFILHLRMKEELLQYTRSVSEDKAVSALYERLQDGHRFANKLSKITGSGSWGSLISRVMRGESLSGPAKKMINSVDPKLFKEFQILSKKYGGLSPDEANRFIKRFTNDVLRNTKITSTMLYDEILKTRTNLYNMYATIGRPPGGAPLPLPPITKDNPLQRGEIADALKALGADNKQVTKMLSDMYQVDIAARRLDKDARNEFKALKLKFKELEDAVRIRVAADQAAYDKSVISASMNEKEGTAQIAGSRIFVECDVNGKKYTGKQMANMVNKVFKVEHGMAERAINKFGNIWRVFLSAKASLDLSMQGVQTLMLQGYDFVKLMRYFPDRFITGIDTEGQFSWAKGAVKNFQYAFSPERAKAILDTQDMRDIMAEMIEHGGGLAFAGSEFTEGVHVLSKWSLPPNLVKAMPWLNIAPKVYNKTAGVAYTRLGDAFSMSRAYSQIKFYEAERSRALAGLVPGVNDAEISNRLVELCRISNDITGTAGGSGLPHWQKSLEGFIFFAPRLNRSVLSLISNMCSKKPYTRKIAWESCMGLLGAATLTYTLAALAMGQKPMLNPLPKDAGGDGGDFMTVDIGGSRIGIGGTFMGLSRLVADNIDHWRTGNGMTTLDPLDPDNPNIRYLRGKLHPATGYVMDVISGQDYMGNLTRDNAATFFAFTGKKVLPIFIESTVDSAQKGASWNGLVVVGAGSFAGFKTTGETPWTRYNMARQLYANQKYGVPFNKLDKVQSSALIRDNPDLKKLFDDSNASMAETMAGIPKFVKENSEAYRKAEAEGLERAAQAYAKGDITAKQFDAELKYLRTYYSGGMNVIYGLRESLDPQAQKAIERWIIDNQTPQDKAYSEYSEYVAKLYEESELPRDYDMIEQKSAEFANRYNPAFRDYFIKAKRNWILSLPPTAKKIMLEREQGIIDSSWWSGYSTGNKASTGYKPNFNVGGKSQKQATPGAYKPNFKIK